MSPPRKELACLLLMFLSVLPMDTSISVTMPLTSRSFMKIPIDKYVPKTFEKDRTKFYFLELEKRRRQECNYNGKQYLYKVSSLEIDIRSSGTAQCTLLHPRCAIYVSFQCYVMTPYSIYIGLKDCPASRIDFQPCDLYSVMLGIVKLLKPDKNSKYLEYTEVSVWGGKERLIITRVVDTYELTLDPKNVCRNSYFSSKS